MFILPTKAKKTPLDSFPAMTDLHPILHPTYGKCGLILVAMGISISSYFKDLLLTTKYFLDGGKSVCARRELNPCYVLERDVSDRR